jgi:hypothetical protein
MPNPEGQILGSCHKKARKTTKTIGLDLPFSQFPLRPALTPGPASSMIRHSLFDIHRFLQGA